MKLQIAYGFHGANCTDLGIAPETYAAAIRAAIQARYPEAEVEVDFDRDTSGALPYSLQPRVYGVEPRQEREILDAVQEIARETEERVLLG